MVIPTLIPIPLNVVDINVAFGVRRILPGKKKIHNKNQKIVMSLLNAVVKSLAMNVKHRICDLMSLISEKDYLPPCQSFSSRLVMRVLPNHRHDPPGLFPYFRRGKFDPLMAVRKVCSKVVDKVRFSVNNDLQFLIILFRALSLSRSVSDMVGFTRRKETPP